jgi:hypothetical protein
MTISAWIMLVVTWTVICYFSIKYFLMVVKKQSEQSK